ncbi:MAG TPA: hypothetical protein VFO79_11225 [Xanthomonadales bacterium]|nr:hypothetical protein [Xanthomonadales bacterium]
MHPEVPVVLRVAMIVVLVAGPLVLLLAGLARMRGEPRAATRAGAGAIAVSTILATLAFNVVFFVQELFLVLPKAFTPGLQPTLFHNNHTWRGSHPLEDLFQGTGASATLVLGLACLAVLSRVALRSTLARFLVFWLSFHGIFMALPQFVVGAFAPGSDVGRAMAYFALSSEAKRVVALLALAAIAAASSALGRRLLAQSPTAASDGMRAKMRFVFEHATLPALLSIAPIIAYRVPREWVEVVFLPVVVAFVGLGFMQAGAWRRLPASPLATHPLAWSWGPLVGAVALLLVFHGLLRRGIAFY